jgi:hypothetical protein
MLGGSNYLRKFCLVLATALLIVGLCSKVQSHSGDEVVAVYGKTPIIDGTIFLGEWDDASVVAFSVTDGACTVYVKQNGTHLHIAFSIADTTYHTNDRCLVYLDVDHNGGTAPQTDDLFLRIMRDGSLYEAAGTGTTWLGGAVPTGWTGAFSSTAAGFQTEYSISYSKIGVTAGVAKTLGIMFESVDNPSSRYGWPPGYSYNKPDTWADLTSPTPHLWIPEPATLVAIAFMLAAVMAYHYIRNRKQPKIPFYNSARYC